jgi:ZIP family zinc transporter
MIAEFGKPSTRLLNWALHAAAGILIAIVAVELIPGAIPTLAGWWIAIAFLGGGVAYILLDVLVERLQWQDEGNDRGRMWMVYIAVAVDLTSDGLLIGAGSAVSPGLALGLAAGQVLADVPEGYATAANFQDKGVPKNKRLWLASSFFIYVVGAALGSYFLLRNASQPIKAAALVAVAGLLTVAAVEDMLEEAHRTREDSRRSVLAFLGGFTIFTLVSAGLETLLGGR